MNKERGQSTLEYVIVLTAIVAAVIVGAALIAGKPTEEGGATTGLAGVMDETTNRITDATSKLPGAVE